jgi:hypothetical protein
LSRFWVDNTFCSYYLEPVNISSFYWKTIYYSDVCLPAYENIPIPDGSKISAAIAILFILNDIFFFFTNFNSKNNLMIKENI